MTENAHPLIVAFEGVDGVGKSTCCRAVQAALAERGVSVAAVAEFESPIGEWLSRSRSDLSPIEKVLYFAADRASTLRQLGALDARVVVWDRFVLSSHAYRMAEIWRSSPAGSTEDMRDFIDQVNREFPLPALSVWLRMDTDEAEDRGDPGHDIDLDLVDRAYAELFARMDTPWIEVDASMMIEDVVQEVVVAVLELLTDESGVRRGGA